MTYSSYYRAGGAMRALALILASVLIVALVWFVSYKNGCISCSNTDSGTDKKGISCQACPNPDEYKKQQNVTPAAETGVDTQPVEENNEDIAVEPQEDKKVSFEVVIDGRSTRFEIDLNDLEDHTFNVSGDEGVSAVFEKGTMTDVKVTVNSENAAEPVEATEPPAPEDVAADAAPEEDSALFPVSDVQDSSDIGYASTNDTETAPVEKAPALQPTAAAFDYDLPAYTLLDGDPFGIDGLVLALGKDVERRDQIVAVMPEDGKTVALLCEPRTTKAVIDDVKEQYPDKIVYTYTTNREFFVNLRGNSKFVIHNAQNKVNVQSGISTPEWFSYGTENVTEEELNSYIAKNQLERYHVMGTKGCRVICDDIDVYRYQWNGSAKYE